MADASLQVELVSADRVVWSGAATSVIARTVEGDVGILVNHAPMLSVLVEGTVEVRTNEGEHWVAAIDAGFLSVAGNRVSILSEYAQMSNEIDLNQARTEAERAQSAGADDPEAAGALRKAQAEIRAVEKAS